MIFFDLDDTLLDHGAAARAGASRFYETFKSRFNEDLGSFLVRWDEVSEKYFQSNNQLRFTLLEQRRMRMREIFPEPISDGEADARFRLYLDTYGVNWKLFPDALPCLRSLKDHQMGLITNGEGEQQRAKIKTLDLGPYFSTVIISREVDCSKPEKEIFQLAAKKAGVDIQDCVYVGDRLRVDALASRDAGMKGIWLDRKGEGAGRDPEVPVIKSLAGLPGLIG